MKILTFILLIFSFSSFASVRVGEVERIDYPRPQEKDFLIFLNDGTVLKVEDNNSNMLLDLEISKRKNSVLKFTTDKNRVILHFSLIESSEEKFPELYFPGEKYEPTVLPNLEEAKTIFKSLRRGASPRSQCYNRAHVWAYESKNKYKLDSMKVFIFYTRKYIREYNFGWWFHVAPFTYVQTDISNEERVLDPMFAKGPLSSKEWTDLFMKNKVTCPVINKYSEYENNEEASYCYLLKESMFYLQPLDLDKLERSGVIKSQWLNYEVKRAYRNGFGMW